jgi:hypothetical protein
VGRGEPDVDVVAEEIDRPDSQGGEADKRQDEDADPDADGCGRSGSDPESRDGGDGACDYRVEHGDNARDRHEALELGYEPRLRLPLRFFHDDATSCAASKSGRTESGSPAYAAESDPNLTQTRNEAPQGPLSFRKPFCWSQADARTRTADPFITSEVLYQLSYVGEVDRV